MLLQQIPVTAVQAALTATAGVATLSLPPHPVTAQQQHLEVSGAGAATATVVLTSENVDKDKLDKGTCTTERCGENQVHCQVSASYCHIPAPLDTYIDDSDWKGFTCDTVLNFWGGKEKVSQ
jgi:hypothetical protein